MKRSGPLSRRTPLAPGKPPKATGPGRRSELKRSAPKPRRRKPGSEPSQATREALYARAGGRCERCGESLEHYGMQAHHRLGRGRKRNDHRLVNLVALCICHVPEVHGHPAAATEAGYMVPSGSRPEDVTVLLWDGRRVLLTEVGEYAEIEAKDGPQATHSCDNMGTVRTVLEAPSGPLAHSLDIDKEQDA